MIRYSIEPRTRKYLKDIDHFPEDIENSYWMQE